MQNPELQIPPVLPPLLDFNLEKGEDLEKLLSLIRKSDLPGFIFFLLAEKTTLDRESLAEYRKWLLFHNEKLQEKTKQSFEVFLARYEETVAVLMIGSHAPSPSSRIAADFNAHCLVCG